MGKSTLTERKIYEKQQDIRDDLWYYRGKSVKSNSVSTGSKMICWYIVNRYGGMDL